MCENAQSSQGVCGKAHEGLGPYSTTSEVGH